MRSQEIDKLAEALAKAQGQMGGAARDSQIKFQTKKGGQFSKKYADLESVWKAVRGPLKENGLAVVQMVDIVNLDSGNPGHVLETLLTHASGQWLSGRQSIKHPGDEQEFGKVISYARRYGLSAMLGVYQEDLDGGGGNGNGIHKETTSSSQNKILTEEEKKVLSEEIPPNNQGDVRFVTTSENTAFKRECFRLKIPSSESNKMLNDHDIPSVDKIPADRFDELFKSLEFLASELNEKK